MKTIDDALELRGRIFGAFELAECEPDPEVRRAWLTFVVVGAGPTGVELAGQIAELARRSLRDNFRRIDPADARVVLLDAAPTVLPPFPESLQRRAARDLERSGVEIHLGAMVTGVDELGLDTSSADPRVKRIDAITKIWAAGVEGSPLGRMVAEAAGTGIDRAGRVQVQPDLTLAGHPEVFAVGDVMSLNGLPGVAQVAISPAVTPPTRSPKGFAATRPSARSCTATKARWPRSRASTPSPALGVSAYRASSLGSCG